VEVPPSTLLVLALLVAGIDDDDELVIPCIPFIAVVVLVMVAFGRPWVWGFLEKNKLQ